MNAAHTQTPRKLSAKWFEDFAVVSEDGEIEDWPEVAHKLIEHADACKIDEAQLESAGEEIERLRKSHDELVAALLEARANLRHATHCLSNQSMVPPQGFNRYPCDCGIDHVRELSTAALKAAKGEA